MPDTTTLLTLLGTFIGGGGLGVLYMRFVDARIKLRKADAGIVMDEKKHADGREAAAFAEAKKAYELLISSFQNTVNEMKEDYKRLADRYDTAISDWTKKHDECVERDTQSRVREMEMKGIIGSMQKDIDRLLDHDKNNKAAREAMSNVGLKVIEKVANDAATLQVVKDAAGS